MQQEIQVNDSIVERFAILNKRDRLAHAYLFIGPSDSGKGETALAIAKLVNCEQSETETFCDACSACVSTSPIFHWYPTYEPASRTAAELRRKPRWR